MDEIRAEIDRLDREILSLLGLRLGYVLAAAKFKTSESAVRAPERLKSMLAQRREWAELEGLDPDVIEQVYSVLVHSFINGELERWKSTQEEIQ